MFGALLTVCCSFVYCEPVVMAVNALFQRATLNTLKLNWLISIHVGDFVVSSFA